MRYRVSRLASAVHDEHGEGQAAMKFCQSGEPMMISSSGEHFYSYLMFYFNVLFYL